MWSVECDAGWPLFAASSGQGVGDGRAGVMSLGGDGGVRSTPAVLIADSTVSPDMSPAASPEEWV